MNLSSAHPSQKFYGGGGGENGFKEGRDDTAAGISSIKPFFNQEVVIVSMSIVTAWHDLEKQGPVQRCLLRYRAYSARYRSTYTVCPFLNSLNCLSVCFNLGFTFLGA